MMKKTINIQVPGNDEVSNLIYEMVFEISIVCEKENINFFLEMKSWSNEKQKDVVLKDSSSVKALKIDEKKIVLDYYENIAKNLLQYLKVKIQTQEELKDFLEYDSYPKINYHKKLLNTFDKEELESFFRKTFTVISILNNTLFEQEVLDETYDKVFQPAEISSWYADDIEVSVDYTDSEFAFIENPETGEVLEPKEYLDRIPDKEEHHETIMIDA